jgi:hypothetical protein
MNPISTEDFTEPEVARVKNQEMVEIRLKTVEEILKET